MLLPELLLVPVVPVLLVASPEELAAVPVPVLEPVDVGSGPVLGSTVVGALVLLPEELDVVVSPTSPPLQAKRVKARQPRRICGGSCMGGGRGGITRTRRGLRQGQRESFQRHLARARLALIASAAMYLLGRSLLVGGLLTLACAEAPRGPVAPRVVVVGAGLAGLTAALDLQDAGWEVIVLEARDRAGGRVSTMHDAFTGGVHAELGGESIDDDHTEIQALVQRFGLALEERPESKELGGSVFYMGSRRSTLQFLAEDATTYADYNRFFTAIAALGEGVDPERPEAFAEAAELDARSLADFVAEQQLSPRAEFLVNIENRADFASEPDAVSLLFVAQQAAAVAGVPDDAAETMRISGGNSSLVDAMAAELGAALRLGAPVTRVEELDDRVIVTAGGEAVEAAFVVMAIPTPPLRKIGFDPPLPDALAAAVQEVDLGHAVKVVTQYERRFWEDDDLDGFTVSEQPFGLAWAPTDSYASEPGLLAQFITGAPAQAAAKLSDAARIAQFQEQLDDVYPEGAPLRTGVAATLAWENEEFTGGAYTVYQPGQMIRHWPAFRAGTEHIRFAGEHTEALAGYMESAVRSGHRVAAELGKPQP